MDLVVGNFPIIGEESQSCTSCQDDTAGVIDAFQKKIETFFEIPARGSSVRTELHAGLILYATMCYIVVVNPEILSAAGLDKGASASATALCGMTSTALLAIFANLPFGSAPGMGLNTLFSYELVRQRHLTAEQALACCFTAGCLFVLFGMTGILKTLMACFPLPLKKAVVVSLGMLQTIVGLAAMGVIRKGSFTLLEAAEINSAEQVIAISTIVLIALLIIFEIPGSILLGILGSMALSLVFKLAPFPQAALSTPYLAIARFDFSIIKSFEGLLIVVLLFLVLFIDTGGVLLGISAQSDVLVDSSGDCVASTRAFTSLGIGVMISAFFGTSPVVIFLESAAAVNQGGRTGLTSLVAAVLLGLSAAFVPVVQSVPASATSPVLVLIGSFMMGAVLAIPWDRVQHSLPAFLTISITSFTCSISNGILAGTSLYAILHIPFIIARLTKWPWLTSRLVHDL